MRQGVWLGLAVIGAASAAPAATYHVARNERGASDASDGLDWTVDAFVVSDLWVADLAPKAGT
jgi:hypothetical protein